MKVKISHTNLTLFLLVVVVFFFSLFFSRYYIDGDQIPYFNAYKDVYGKSLFEGFWFYHNRITTREPIHYLLVWAASNLGFDKNFVMSVANSILAYVTVRVFLKWKVSIYVAVIIVCTNYYLWVLYFAAERLKFSFIFLMLSFIYVERQKKSIYFAITSILSHTQQIIIYGSILFSFAVKNSSYIIKYGRVKKNKIYFLIAFILFSAILYFYLGDHLRYKFISYFSTSPKLSFMKIWKCLIFLILTLLVSNKWTQIFSIFSVLIIATLLFGDIRVNMMSFLVLMYFSLHKNRGINLILFFTTSYMLLKTCWFVYKTITTGQGFG